MTYILIDMSSTIEKLRQDFKDFLNKHDLRLAWVAKRMDLSIGTLSLFLNSKINNPHKRTVYKIKKFIGEEL